MTEAQGRVLRALRDVTDDGWSATVQEITDRAGLASKSTCWHHLNALEDAGLAERHPRNPKGGWRAADQRDGELVLPSPPYEWDPGT